MLEKLMNWLDARFGEPKTDAGPDSRLPKSPVVVSLPCTPRCGIRHRFQDDATFLKQVGHAGGIDRSSLPKITPLATRFGFEVVHDHSPGPTELVLVWIPEEVREFPQLIEHMNALGVRPVGGQLPLLAVDWREVFDGPRSHPILNELSSVNTYIKDPGMLRPDPPRQSWGDSSWETAREPHLLSVWFTEGRALLNWSDSFAHFGGLRGQFYLGERPSPE